MKEWIKHKTGIVRRNIYLQYLLLWQRRIEVTRAHQKFFNLIYQILFLSFNSTISNREIVVKLDINVRLTSNVTCGNVVWRRDFDITQMIFLVWDTMNEKSAKNEF